MTQVNDPVGQIVDPVDPASEAAKKDFVSLDTHRKLLDEKKKLQAKLDELDAEKRRVVEEEARKRGDYEAIAKLQREELEKTKQDLAKYQSMIMGAKKHHAVLQALGGAVEPRWQELIDVEDVIVNPETGEVDALTAAKVAENFKRNWPEAFKSKVALPSDAPQGLQGGAGKISREEWLKLPAKEMLKWKPDQIAD